MFFREIFLSITTYIISIKYVFKLYKYLFVIIFLLLIFLLPVLLIDSVTSGLISLIPYKSADKYAIISVQFIANLTGFFLLLILSPVFSLISEQTTHLLSGTIYKFSLKQLMKDIIRGIKITLRNFILEYFYIFIISIILHFLPENNIIQITGIIINTIIVSYFYGFSLLNYAMENNQLNYKKSVNFVRSHSGMAIGIGLVYYLIISLNNITFVEEYLEHLGIYWTAFGEGFIAFAGVITGSILFHEKYYLQA